MTSQTGGSGGTDYGKWDNISTHLVEQTLEEEQAEEKAASAALGHDTQPFSQAEADERVKLEKARRTKEVLDGYKQREEEGTLFVQDVLFEGEDHVVELTRQHFDGNDSEDNDDNDNDSKARKKRVLCIRNCSGPGTIVLTPDISKLESVPRSPASAADDNNNNKEESKSQPQQPQYAPVYGIIKLFLNNLRNVTIISRCKIVTSSIEMTHCHNVTLIVEQHKVSTLQVDLSSDIHLQFVGVDFTSDGFLFGGHGTKDRIYHAGVTNMNVLLKRGKGDTCHQLEKRNIDYLQDGAVSMGSATKEEYQFVTYVQRNNDDGTHSSLQLVTERFIRSKGTSAAVMDQGSGYASGWTETEWKQRQARLQQQPDETKTQDKENNHREEILRTCEKHRLDGNEAFKTGEYAQAVLLYTLAIDQATEIEEQSESDTTYPSLHICYANRSAAFLKLGHHDKALADATQCTTLNAEYVKGLFRRGLALHAMGQYQEAREWLVKALSKEPKNGQIQQALKFCEVRLEMEMRKRAE